LQAAALGFFRMQASGASSPMFVIAIQLLGIILIVYFLFVRPQKKEQEKHREMVEALTRGDRVATSGGVRGTIVKVQDDSLILQSGDARIEVERGRVARLITEQPTDEG
jgi:preprotein translocase subunit YajC